MRDSGADGDPESFDWGWMLRRLVPIVALILFATSGGDLNWEVGDGKPWTLGK